MGEQDQGKPCRRQRGDVDVELLRIIHVHAFGHGEEDHPVDEDQHNINAQACHNSQNVSNRIKPLTRKSPRRERSLICHFHHNVVDSESTESICGVITYKIEFNDNLLAQGLGGHRNALPDVVGVK